MAAIFLIVVLASLAAFAVHVALTQYEGTGLQLTEARAQAAADSGFEYAANRALRGVGGCGAVAPALTFPPAAPGLSGYTVTLTCSASNNHRIGGAPYSVYTLTAVARFGTYGQPGYVSRTMTGNVTNAPP